MGPKPSALEMQQSWGIKSNNFELGDLMDHKLHCTSSIDRLQYGAGVDGQIHVNFAAMRPPKLLYH